MHVLLLVKGLGMLSLDCMQTLLCTRVSRTLYYDSARAT